MRFILFKFLFLALLSLPAYAEIPSNYLPMVIEAPFSFSERVFDINPALEESKRVKKPVLLYLGAADCPPCKAYTSFLKNNASDLQPHFAKYVVADIRTWLRGSKIHFQVRDEKLTSKEFLMHIGDDMALVYPSWWILDHQAKVIKKLPRGFNNFLDIEKHKQLLSLEQR